MKNYSDHLVENAGGAVLRWIIEGAQRIIEKTLSAQVVRTVTKSNVLESRSPSESRVSAHNREQYAALCDFFIVKLDARSQLTTLTTFDALASYPHLRYHLPQDDRQTRLYAFDRV